MVIFWKRVDFSGHEWCRLTDAADGSHVLQGVVLVQYGKSPAQIQYSIRCRASWETESVEIAGGVGRKEIALSLKVNRKKQWRLNGQLVAAVNGCIDVDLGFSPSTNLLPIRRLKLKSGEIADVTAAWVEFPTFKLKPLKQCYSRDADLSYHYESAGGSFQRDLVVDKNGFVRTYPGLWETEGFV